MIQRQGITRSSLSRLNAVNFVIENVLGGGVTTNIAMDLHGENLSSLMLTIKVPAIFNVM